MASDDIRYILRTVMIFAGISALLAIHGRIIGVDAITFFAFNFFLLCILVIIALLALFMLESSLLLEEFPFLNQLRATTSEGIFIQIVIGAIVALAALFYGMSGDGKSIKYNTKLLSRYPVSYPV